MECYSTIKYYVVRCIDVFLCRAIYYYIVMLIMYIHFCIRVVYINIFKIIHNEFTVFSYPVRMHCAPNNLNSTIHNIYIHFLFERFHNNDFLFRTQTRPLLMKWRRRWVDPIHAHPLAVVTLPHHHTATT